MSVKPVHAFAIQHVINKKGFIDLPSLGTSMYPLIKQRDTCRFVSCRPDQLTKGEVLLFHLNGELIGHRLIEKVEVEGKIVFQCKGDTNLGKDQWIMEKDIIGKLLYVKRRKRSILAFDHLCKLWGWSVLSFPLMSSFLRFYLNKKGI
ncbi:hypothetical protein LD39_08580 [Halobacillus sp. BBL2006]|nr:hypothetical protein LD39_08580 [Halobacillus sp. BBL2006]